MAVLVLIGSCDYGGYFEFGCGLQPLSLALAGLIQGWHPICASVRILTVFPVLNKIY